jgi:2-haloacid dehalogenase/putative hydrolase of the HAD superfamily
MSAPASPRASRPRQQEEWPKAVLFDVGNVMVSWNPRTLYSKLIPDPAELDRFLAEVCPMSWHAQTDVGRTFADNIAERIAVYPDHEALIRAWWDRWPEMFSGAIPETEAVIEDLYSRGVPMHGLTNMSIESWPMVQAMSPAFRRLDIVVVSAEERLMKPDPAIFTVVCDRTGLAPSDMLFVDDSLPNIETAARLGFHVHHFTDPAAFRPQLEAFGLL